jgi:L-amino acid N-acyltransferase YncA
MSPATNLILRLATPADGAACAALYRPYVEGSPISFERTAPDADEMGRRIAGVMERTPWLVAEIDGVVRGYAYGIRHRERAAYDWTVETTVYVDEAFPRHGIGQACMRALLEILRTQGFHLVVAGVTLPNVSSVALHTALGFRSIGTYPAIGYKDGRWYDVGWFGLELGQRPEAPVPIRPITELVGSPELERALARERVLAP